MRPAFAVALGVVLLAGCGGGGGKALTKEEYAAKADAICSKYVAKLKAFNPSSRSEFVRIANEVVPIVDDAIAKLKRLEPPAEVRGLASQWLVQLQALGADIKELRDKAKANDLQAIPGILPKAELHLSRSNQLASQLGMKVCNSP